MHERSVAELDYAYRSSLLKRNRPLHAATYPIVLAATFGLAAGDPTALKQLADRMAAAGRTVTFLTTCAQDHFTWENNLPPGERPPIPADLEMEEKVLGDPAPPKAFLTQQDYRELSGLLEKVDTLGFSELTIRRDDLAFKLKGDVRHVPVDADDRPVSAPDSTDAGAKLPAPAPAASAPAAAPHRTS